MSALLNLTRQKALSLIGLSLQCEHNGFNSEYNCSKILQCFQFSYIMFLLTAYYKWWFLYLSNFPAFQLICDLSSEWQWSEFIFDIFEQVALSRSVFQQGLKYSTTGDSDTHEDFKPTSKLEGSGFSLQDVVRKVCGYRWYWKGVFEYQIFWSNVFVFLFKKDI